MTAPQWIIEALRLRGADWTQSKRNAYGFMASRCAARASECEMLADYLECAVALGLERMPTTKEFNQWFEDMEEDR